MIYRILFFLYFFVSIQYSAASTFITSQDGNWEDSATWNNISVSDTLSGDTIIIRNHINFNTELILTDCYLQIDSSGTLCGHDSVDLYNSQLWEYGGFYAEHVFAESSQWKCYYGSWLVIVDVDMTGAGSQMLLCCGCGGRVGGCFTCTVPVQLCADSTQSDSTQHNSTIISPPQPSLSIFVYNSPSVNQFTIDSEIPDSNSHITLTIYDLLGRKMKSISIADGKSSVTIFTDKWAAGIYLLSFEQGGKIIQTDKIERVQ